MPTPPTSEVCCSYLLPVSRKAEKSKPRTKREGMTRSPLLPLQEATCRRLDFGTCIAGRLPENCPDGKGNSLNMITIATLKERQPRTAESERAIAVIRDSRSVG